VLIIDDVAAVGRGIARLLQRSHAVTCVIDAGTALALLVSNGARFDAILCDLHMPDMNGTDFVSALAAVLPAQASRVIFMTGAVTSSTSTLRSHGNEYLAKPFSAEALRAAIDRLVSSTAGPDAG
jgi:CheY-like chemotaxis protein